jgi:putative ABC transport system permease protein
VVRSWPRTALSASGVAVGIASVVVLIGAGVGAERALLEVLESLGRNLLVVNVERTETGVRGASQIGTGLRLGDWAAVEAGVPGVLRTAPVVERNGLARVGGRLASITVTGTTPEFQTVRNFPLAAGRFLDEEDVRARRRVAVVGGVVVDELFGGESPVGGWLRIRGVPFRIVGVNRRKGIVDGANEDDQVIIPLSTAMRRLLNVDYLSRLYVQADSEETIDEARSITAALLRRRHGERPDGTDRFSIQDQTALVRAQRQAGGSLSRTVIVLSGLALGLGGVGLLAVSLLSVRERYPEIGLRLAVGGRPRDVLLQFLSEAVLISILGGLAGVALGGLGIRVGMSLTRWPMVLNWQAVAYPLTISVAIAVIFGTYPALLAARLDPIRALNNR